MAIEYKPVTQQALQDTAKANIGARRSKYMRDLMDQITFQKRLPGSDLEGASRVFTGLLSGYHEGKLSNQELAQREALVKALEGENLSPMEMQLAAQGDPSTINSIVQNRLAERTYGRRRADSLSDAETAHKRALELRGIEERVRLAAEKRRAEQIAQRDANKFEQQKELQRLKSGLGEKEKKTLNPGDVQRITDRVSPWQTYEGITQGFDDSYGGMGAGSETVAGWLNWFARQYPETAGDKAAKAAQWWQAYKRNSELIERHELFGAAFTATEANAWKSADIDPSMGADTIKAAIRTRQRILREKIKKHLSGLTPAYRDDQLSGIFGFDVTDPKALDNYVASAVPDFTAPEQTEKKAEEAPAPGPALPPTTKPAMTDTSALPDETYKRAAEAVRRGAPIEAVKKRLQENGIDPAGLDKFME